MSYNYNTKEIEIREALEKMKVEYAKKARKLKKADRASKRKQHVKQKLLEIELSSNCTSSQSALASSIDVDESSLCSADNSHLDLSDCGQSSMSKACAIVANDGGMHIDEDSFIVTNKSENLVNICHSHCRLGVDKSQGSVGYKIGFGQSKPCDESICHDSASSVKTESVVDGVTFQSASENSSGSQNANSPRTVEKVAVTSSDGINRIMTSDANNMYLCDREIDMNCAKFKRHSSRLVGKSCSQENSMFASRKKTLPVSPLFYSSARETLQKRLKLLNLSNGKHRTILPQLPEIIIEQNLMTENFTEFSLPDGDFPAFMIRLKLNGEKNYNDFENNALKKVISQTKCKKNDSLENNEIKDNIDQNKIQECSTLSTVDQCQSETECKSATTIGNVRESKLSDSYKTQIKLHSAYDTPLRPISAHKSTPTCPTLMGNFADFSPFTPDMSNLKLVCRKNKMPFATSTPILNCTRRITCDESTPKTPVNSAVSPGNNAECAELDKASFTCFKCGSDVQHMAATKTQKNGDHTFSNHVLFTVSPTEVCVWMDIQNRWACLHSWHHVGIVPHALHTLTSSNTVSLVLNDQVPSNYINYCWDNVNNTAHGPHTFTLPDVTNSSCVCSVSDSSMISAHTSGQLQKHSLDPYTGSLTLIQSWTHSVTPVTSLCSVDSLHAAVLGLSDMSQLFIWNHEVGILLANIQLDLADPGIDQWLTLQWAKDKGGLLCVMIMGESSSVIGQRVAVNAMTRMSKTIHSYELPGKPKLKGRNSVLLDDHLVTLKEGVLEMSNLMNGQTETISRSHGHSVVTLASYDNCFYVAHSKGYIHVYRCK